MGHQTTRTGNHTAKVCSQDQDAVVELPEKVESGASSLAQDNHARSKLTAPDDHMAQELVSHHSAVAWQHL